MARAPGLPAEEYLLNVNVARGLLAAFETATKVWDYPDDDTIRCRPVRAPVRSGDDTVLATFDLFLPDGRSAEVDMAGSRAGGSRKIVWTLREARFFLPCRCGRVHRELEIDAEGIARRAPLDCDIAGPVTLPDA